MFAHVNAGTLVSSPSGRASRASTANLFGVPRLSVVRLGWTAAIVVLLSFWSNTAWLVASGDFDLAAYGMRFFGYIRQYGPWVFLATIAVTIADASPLRGSRRVIALAVALTLACWAGLVATSGLECLAEGHCFKGPTLFSPGQVLFNLQQVPSTVGQAAAFALVHFTWRRDAEVAAALYASEVARVEAERSRVHAALQAMQARVEPAFLLATLGEIGIRGGSDRATGIRLLDLLIKYLRAALPRERQRGSTFTREGALLRAYLGMCALRSDGSLVTTCRFDDELAGAAFPPMVLGPLVAAAAPPPMMGGTIDVDARALEHRVRVSVIARGEVAAPLADAQPVAEVRERVTSLYGERGTLTVDRPGVDVLVVILEIPRESADGRHR